MVIGPDCPSETGKEKINRVKVVPDSVVYLFSLVFASLLAWLSVCVSPGKGH